MLYLYHCLLHEWCRMCRECRNNSSRALMYFSLVFNKLLFLFYSWFSLFDRIFPPKFRPVCECFWLGSANDRPTLLIKIATLPRVAIFVFHMMRLVSSLLWLERREFSPPQFGWWEDMVTSSCSCLYSCLHPYFMMIIQSLFINTCYFLVLHRKKGK